MPNVLTKVLVALTLTILACGPCWAAPKAKANVACPPTKEAVEAVVDRYTKNMDILRSDFVQLRSEVDKDIFLSFALQRSMEQEGYSLAKTFDVLLKATITNDQAMLDRSGKSYLIRLMRPVIDAMAYRNGRQAFLEVGTISKWAYDTTNEMDRKAGTSPK